MEHRHLLPNEIDLLLDGEIGFNVTPLRTHTDDCPDCEARLARARVIVDKLEHLPHFVPNARFADRVMQQVHIVEPWHVAALDTARRLVPQSRTMRILMGATASAAAVLISGSAVWLAFRADVAIYAFHLATDRARGALLTGVGHFIGDTFGQPALDAMRTGGFAGIAMGAGVMLAAVGLATFGFKSLATASRRSRE